VGLAAAAAGANEVWNVDFSSTNLGVGRRNAEMNGIPKSSFQTIEEDCLPTMRQLAGLPDLGRRDIKLNRKVKKFEAKQFDLVFLDPPAWSKGPFGAVDIEGDYPSLFKSAVLCAKPQGGRIIATHNLASVELETWLDVLKRCAAKAGRPIVSIETLAPEEDFPSFDGRYPLKIAICEV
jgi:23S rRNA (cytosine1962-C5)-methyltransferase